MTESSLLTTALSALLTVMVLSYLLGDNPLFRTAVHVFIGVTAGYAGAIALRSVLWPRLVEPLLSQGIGALSLFFGLSWLLVLLLALKASPSTATWGSLPLALLVGVGAALVVGGAVTGTLVPQTMAAMATLSPGAIPLRPGEGYLEAAGNALLMLTGTVTTLFYFRFTARRSPTGEPTRSLFMAIVAYIGRLFIALTFAVMYAGVLAASITVLTERLKFLLAFILEVVQTLKGG